MTTLDYRTESIPAATTLGVGAVERQRPVQGGDHLRVKSFAARRLSASGAVGKLLMEQLRGQGFDLRLEQVAQQLQRRCPQDIIQGVERRGLGPIEERSLRPRLLLSGFDRHGLELVVGLERRIWRGNAGEPHFGRPHFPSLL